MRQGKRRYALGVHWPRAIVIVSGSVVPVKKTTSPISRILEPDLSAELNWSAFGKIDVAYVLAFVDQIFNFAYN